MTDPTIDQFFPPLTPSRSVKRQRPHSSPGAEMPEDNMMQVPYSQLMADLNKLFDEKLSTLASKEELLTVSRQVTDLTEQNNALREEIDKMKAQEKVMLGKLVDLEGRSRRNNLIFKGLKVNENTRDFKSVVTKFLTQVIRTQDNIWVNRAHPLGRDRKTIIAHIPDDTDIDYIMSKTKTLQGTGFAVHRDYPREVREKRAKLAAVRTEVERVSGKQRQRLFHDHLTINGCRFTWDNGQLRAGESDGGERLFTLLNHDFSSFLTKLRQGGVERQQPPASAGVTTSPPSGMESKEAPRAQETTNTTEK